jgi:hydroxymethylglutaryl-CoA reductase
MIIEGFSKLSREQKIQIAAQYSSHPLEFANRMLSNWHPELKAQTPYTEFTENAVSNFCLPYSLSPNFLINGREYIIPMVTEESSVVAAASSAAKFWYSRGGFHTTVSKMVKPGHIHFLWKGDPDILEKFIHHIIPGLKAAAAPIEKSMKERGGGIENIGLKDLNRKLPAYYQLEVLFSTVDAMGANFINSCLEAMSEFFQNEADKAGIAGSLEIIMAILSNYTPDCIVKCQVGCHVNELGTISATSAGNFVKRFEIAVNMAANDVNRAVTHNKGIFNGIDAVLIATGNDFRATEAAGHAWAAKTGRYTSLSEIRIENGRFEFTLELPMAVGVTGGLTSIHPLAKASLQLMGNPNAGTLMEIAASAGLANHFAAIRSLITTGIQKGHMKMHLKNILNSLDADEKEKEKSLVHFRDVNVTYTAVKEFLASIREK